MSSQAPEGPGWGWQLLEFFGMTWPGHKARAEAARSPRCGACGNPTELQADGTWRCRVHPVAPVEAPPPHE
ncbi:MAG: hypothetical protein KC549_12125 [Myxococcales bacterium]|nr:hypothetical protein [Myxococcales bacterium]MCB9547789.1 hypothetical protein [Myxococcales bacterium]